MAKEQRGAALLFWPKPHEPFIIAFMENRTTPAEAAALLRELFPDGLVSAEVLHTLCPEGWLQSPLRTAFLADCSHPSLV